LRDDRRAKLKKFFERRFIPEPTDDTATLTFIKFEGSTYAVTAGHVITAFASQALAEAAAPESYFVPTGKGIGIQPPFIVPLPIWPDRAPDIALRKIDDRLPAHIGKEAFDLLPDVRPEFPIPYAGAVGFPTFAKAMREEPGGARLAMPCVHAVAEGIGSSEHADQVQFYSEITAKVDVSSLSGMSGGPVFWSDGHRLGLLGFVKEALDVEPRLARRRSTPARGSILSASVQATKSSRVGSSMPTENGRSSARH